MTSDMRSAWSHQLLPGNIISSSEKTSCFFFYSSWWHRDLSWFSNSFPSLSLSLSLKRARSLSLTHGRWAPENTINGKRVREIPLSCLGFRRASKGVGVFWKRSPSEPAWTQSEHGCKAPGCWMRTRPRRGKRPPGLRLRSPPTERGPIVLLAFVLRKLEPDCGGLSLWCALLYRLVSFYEFLWMQSLGTLPKLTFFCMQSHLEVLRPLDWTCWRNNKSTNCLMIIIIQIISYLRFSIYTCIGIFNSQISWIRNYTSILFQ